MASFASLLIAVFSVLLDLRGRDLLLIYDVTLDLLPKIVVRRSACLICAFLCTFKSVWGYLALCSRALCWVVLFWIDLVATYLSNIFWRLAPVRVQVNEYLLFPGCGGVAAVTTNLLPSLFFFTFVNQVG